MTRKRIRRRSASNKSTRENLAAGPMSGRFHEISLFAERRREAKKAKRAKQAKTPEVFGTRNGATTGEHKKHKGRTQKAQSDRRFNPLILSLRFLCCGLCAFCVERGLPFPRSTRMPNTMDRIRTEPPRCFSPRHGHPEKSCSPCLSLRKTSTATPPAARLDDDWLWA